jgi:UDP-glucose 4-epimerase
MRVVVTGGAGFIGSHVCESLTQKNAEVFCIDNLDPYYDQSIKRANIRDICGSFKFINVDIRNPEKLRSILAACDPDYIIHEAAQAGVRMSMKHPMKAAETNIAGTINILEAAKDIGIKKFVFASSSSVYGRVEYMPFDEKHPTNPMSPYGVSKLSCEKYLQTYSRLYGLKYVALRYFSVYGPRIRPDLAISKFTAAALADSRLEVYGDGSKSRDFTYVSDAVDATLKALNRGSGEYNVGGGSVLTVRELAERIIGLIGGGRIRYAKSHEGDVEHTASDTRKARKDLGWKPKRSLDGGLAETIEWLSANRQSRA